MFSLARACTAAVLLSLLSSSVEAGRTTSCPDMTYYGLDHGRYIALPWKYASGYGNITHAVRGKDFRCYDKVNITELILGPATAASNLTTEMADVDSLIHPWRVKYVAKRWVFGALSLFMSAIGFAGTIMSAACTINVTLAGENITQAGKNNCIVGSIFMAVTAAYGGAVAFFGSAASAYKEASDTYTYVSGIVKGQGSAAMQQLLNSIGNSKRDDLARASTAEIFRAIRDHHKNLGTLANLTVGGLSLVDGVGLHTPSGHEHRLIDLLAADHLQPLQVTLPHTAHNITADMWIAQHPFNASRSVVHHRARLHTVHAAINRSKRENYATGTLSDGSAVQLDQSDDELLKETGEDTTTNGDGNPSIYYGVDFYENNGAEDIDATLGPADGENADSVEGNADMAEKVIDNQSWDNCVCTQVNGQWTSTGSVQYSWDHTYNGYSACYAKNCDGA